MSGFPGKAAAAAVVAVESARLQLRSTWRHPLVLISTVVQPLTLLLIVTQRAGAAASPSRTGDLLVSVVLTSFWGGTIWTAGGILRRDRGEGTLAATLLNAHDGRLVVLGRCFGATLTTLASLAATGIALMLLIRRPIELPGVGWVVFGFVGVLVSGTVLGLLLSCILLTTRHGNAITNALTYPVFIFGGLLIPQTILPDRLQWISGVVSLSWARQFVVDADWSAGGMLVLVTAGYAVAGLYLFRRILIRAKQKGSLELV
ncbi:MAG: ABC transporter permease [Stackebrandtia sp.]